MRRLPVVLASILLLSLAPASTGQTSGVGTGWRESLVIDSGLAGPQKMFEAFDTASLNMYDFNGDGQMEIVSNNDNNRVYVLDSRSGRLLAEITTFHYNNSKWPTRELNPVAIGDIYGDGVPCLAIPNSASWLTVTCYDAAASTPSSFKFVEKWRVHVDAADYEPDFKATHPYLYHENGTAKHTAGMDGHAYLSDVDGDGKMEVFVETDSWPGQFAFTHDGKYLWSRSFADGNSGAIVRDIDKDKVKEAVFFSDGGLVTAYNAKTGGVEWNFDARKHGATPGSIPVAGLVADLGGDGTYETVFGARHAVQTNDPDWINQSHARYFALNSKGQLIWNVSYDWMNPLQYNHPAAVDANGDGVLDVAFMDWNTIGHKPGNWNTTNRKSNLFILDGRDGSEIWHKGISVYWSNKDFVIFDTDGDGDLEIVAPTAKNGCEGLGAYDLKTGDDRGFFCAGAGWSMTRGPVAANLYGDGKTYLVVPYNKRADGTPYRSIDVGYREGKLVVIETGAAFSSVRFSAMFTWNDQIDTGLKGTSGTPPPTPTPTPTPVVTPSPTAPTPASPAPVTPSPSPSPSPTPSPSPSPSPSPVPTPTTPDATPTPTTTSGPTPPGTPPTTSPEPTPTPAPNETPSPISPTQESTVPGVGIALLCAGLVAAAFAFSRRK